MDMQKTNYLENFHVELMLAGGDLQPCVSDELCGSALPERGCEGIGHLQPQPVVVVVEV